MSNLNAATTARSCLSRPYPEHRVIGHWSLNELCGLRHAMLKSNGY